MNRALIDALAVSWWYDAKTNGPNHILNIVYEKAAAHNLKITIDYEHGKAPLDTVDHDLLYSWTVIGTTQPCSRWMVGPW